MFKRIVSVVVLIVFLAGLIYIPKLDNVYAAVIDDVGDLNLAIDTLDFVSWRPFLGW